MSNEPLIQVKGLSKKFSKDLKRSLWYGLMDVGKEVLGLSEENRDQLRKTEFWAVKDVSFELRRGECLGLIGRNGAGKTTLLKMLNGLVKPDQGSIEIQGRVGALISLGTGFDPILTGRENIYVNASVLGIRKAEIDEKIDEIIEFSELGDFIESPVRSYSSGMISRLGFAIAVHMKPDILILDEVLAVGDAGFKMKSLNKMYEIMNDTAVIFVNHNMATLSRVCNKVMYLEKGEVKYFSNNVLEGIEMYLDQFDDERGYIDYNDKAHFRNITISSGTDRGVDKKNRTILHHGDDMIIEYDYYLQPQYGSHNIAVAISNKDFLTVMLQITEPLDNSPDGHNRVRIRIPNVQLTNGEYSITFKISSAEDDDRLADIYATYRHWLKFKMEGLNVINNVPFYVYGEVEKLASDSSQNVNYTEFRKDKNTVSETTGTEK